MNILIVVGARPNFMKAAPIIAAIGRHNRNIEIAARGRAWLADPIRYLLVHTGQHYDEMMSDVFFQDLNLPKPDIHLGVGSGSHANQTAEIMKKFEPVVLAEKPEAVLVVGDVNSTLACALVTSKVAFDPLGTRPLIAHVEAGLRSFDRTMPEEINRLITDQISDLLFATERSAVRNLRDEGVPFYKIHFVGNTMIDSLLALKEKSDESAILDTLNLRFPEGHAAAGSIRPYALLTLHRPSNVDDSKTLSSLLHGLEELAQNRPIVFPAHPRTRRRLEQFGISLTLRPDRGDARFDASAAGTSDFGFVLTDPLRYLDFLCLMRHASLVVTDSGGVQEETTCVGIPCVTVRENTERPVTVEMGTNVVAGTGKERVRAAVRRQITRKYAVHDLPENWDGMASARIVAALVHACSYEGPRTAVATSYRSTPVHGAMGVNLP